MSPRLKEFIIAVLLDLAENCDWTISPTGQIEHSPFFEYAEKHLHIIEAELADMREMFKEYVESVSELLHEDTSDACAEHHNKLHEKAKETLGL